jgi:hypothetical protein
MKKTLVALAAMAATGAFAQSTVTLSGSIMYGVSTSVTHLQSLGAWKGDRNTLTFGAVEDLGGGLKVSTSVQARWNSATGIANNGYVNSATGNSYDNLFEQTKLTVDSQYGQVAFGRFTNAIGVAPVHVLEDSAQTTASGQAANGRMSGQFQYMSPNVAGFQVWAFNAKNLNNKYFGGGTGAGYSSTWDLSLANLATNTKTRWQNANATGVNYTNGPIYAQYYEITDLMGLKETKISGVYDLGFAKLYANQFNQKSNITQVVAPAAAGLGTKGMAAHKATELAVNVPYGAFNFQLGRFTVDKDLDLSKTDGSTKTSKTGWGATYDFSKRTKAVFAASVTEKGSANLNAGSLLTGRNQYIGLAHNF